MVGLRAWAQSDNDKITLADGNSISTDLGSRMEERLEKG